MAQETFICDVCMRRFGERRRLTQHKKTHSRPLVCEACSKGFASRFDLARHVAAVHRVGVDSFHCNAGYCNYRAKRKDNLSQHVRNFHPDLVSRSPEVVTPSKYPVQLDFDGTNAATDLLVKSRSRKDLGWNVLMAAASKGDVSLLKDMLQKGLDINVKAEDGYSALHCAARSGRIEMIQCLLQEGAALEARNNQVKGRRAIHEAILGKQPEAVAALLEAGADILTPDGNGDTVIDYIATSRHVELAKALFQHDLQRSSVDHTVSSLVIQSARIGAHAILEWLLTRYPQTPLYSSKLKVSPIYIAARLGHQHTLQILLSFMQSSDEEDSGFIKTVSLSLTCAARKGAVEMAKMLLKCKAIEVNRKLHGNADTALQVAIDGGHESIIILLLSHPDINVKDITMHGAVRKGAFEIVKMVLEHKNIDVNKGYRYSSNTALQEAIDEGNERIVRLLLNHSDIDVKNIKMHEAARAGYTEIIRILLDHGGIDILKDDYQGRTFLHAAAEAEQKELIRLLLNQTDIDCHHKDMNGHTPFVLAFLNCKWDIVRLDAEYNEITKEFQLDALSSEVLSKNPQRLRCLTKFLDSQNILATHVGKWPEMFWQEIIRSRKITLMEILLEEPSFDINSILHVNGTMLHLAAQHHGHEVFRFLLSHPRINCNARDDWGINGDCVLHSAVQHNCMTSVKMLLAHEDIDLSLRGWYGQTALDLARSLGRTEMIELLSKCDVAGSRTSEDTFMVRAMWREEEFRQAPNCEEYARQRGAKANVQDAEVVVNDPVEVEIEDTEMESDSEEQ